MNGIEQQAMPIQELYFLHVQGIYSVCKMLSISQIVFVTLDQLDYLQHYNQSLFYQQFVVTRFIFGIITLYIRILEFEWLIACVFFIFRINSVHFNRCRGICMRI